MTNDSRIADSLHDGEGNQTMEIKIADITYVVSVGQSEHARETLDEKLKKLILDTVRRQRQELSEE